jgi:hypothetical protein
LIRDAYLVFAEAGKSTKATATRPVLYPENAMRSARIVIRQLRRIAQIPVVFATLAAMLVTGCGMPGAPLAPSLNLPDRVGNLAAVRNGDQVALTWKMPVRNTDKVLLKGPIATHICRNQVNAASCTIVHTLQLAPGSDAAFTDALPTSFASGSPHAVNYFVELVNRKGRSAGLSNGVEILAGQAPPAITGLTAEVGKQGVVLQWAPAPPGSQPTAIRLVRTLLTPPAKEPSKGPISAPPEPQTQTFLVDTSVPATHALDSTIRFGAAYEYRAQRVARISENGQMLELAGPLSAPCPVDAVDVFPPAVPQGLAAVAALGENGNPPAIDLSWQPVTDPDLAGYIVYRREGESDWQRISPAQPVIGPGFRDSAVQIGNTYLYAVSAIGQNSRESARSAPAEEAVPGP